MNNIELLNLAKRRYPIGCKFKSEEMNRVYTVTGNDFYHTPPNKSNHKGILVSCNNSFGQHIYYENQWAEYAEVYGFKVGDTIPFGILNKWVSIEGNCFEDGTVVKWVGNWYKDRTIEKIQFINNTICFQMSDSFDWIWIKAEGLREFIKQQTKNKMKTQTLTLGQLKDLYKADDCPDWRKYIEDYIHPNWWAKDTSSMPIKQSDLDYAKQHASKAQLKLLQDAGLVFEEECPYKVGDWVTIEKQPLFWNCLYGKDNSVLKYPLTGKISKLGTSDLSSEIGFSIGEYGYNLTRLQKQDNIRKATLEEIKYAQIKWDKLKTGSVVKLNKQIGCLKSEVETSIVLFNSGYYVNSDCNFQYSTETLVTTFSQKTKTGKHIYEGIKQDRIKEHITEVISY
jgi:hypothetical protein